MRTQRFHEHRGENIQLLDDQMVAYRESSFAHGISFSKEPLHPNEIFLIEIEKNERGWSGHLRIGLTQHNPNDEFPLPQYALPDLANMNAQQSWIFAVTKSNSRFFEAGDGGGAGTIGGRTGGNGVRSDLGQSRPYRSVLGDDEYVKTYRGLYHRSVLKSLPPLRRHDSEDLSEATGNNSPRLESSMLATDVGSRIGIVYVTRGDTAEMHFILNGEDQGPCAKDIPYKNAPLYAVVDVYGTTKQVRIVQLNFIATLQNACRETILQCTQKDKIDCLPIPNKLKEYLRYEAL